MPLREAKPRFELAMEWENRVATFLDAGAGARFKAVDTRGAPNAANVVAMDCALRTVTGISLMDAIPTRPLRPLLVGERRYFAASVDVDHTGAERQSRRACVEYADGKRYYEAPRRIRNGALDDYTIHILPDQGPKSWRGYMWLMFHLKLRGYIQADPWHIGWGATKHAVADAGLYLLLIESTVVCNLRHGPWLGAGFLGQLRESATRYFACATWRCELFQRFYPGICQDRWRSHGVVALNFESDEHKAGVFESLKASPIISKTGGPRALASMVLVAAGSTQHCGHKAASSTKPTHTNSRTHTAAPSTRLHHHPLTNMCPTLAAPRRPWMTRVSLRIGAKCFCS